MLDVVKGLPHKSQIEVLRYNDDDPIDLNDGSWNFTAEIRRVSSSGVEPFSLTTSANGSAVVLDMTANNTLLLDENQNYYSIYLTIAKTDNSVILKERVPVNVKNDI